MKIRYGTIALAGACLVACSGGTGTGGDADEQDTVATPDVEEDLPPDTTVDTAVEDTVTDTAADTGLDTTPDAPEDTAPEIVEDVVEEDGGTVTPMWSFAVFADPRGNQPEWIAGLEEARDLTENPGGFYQPPEMVIVAGDIDPISERYADWQDVFSGDPLMQVFIPAVGNHDWDRPEDISYICDTILPAQPGLTMSPEGCNSFHVTWKNVRVISVDAYDAHGEEGCVDDAGREWVEDVILSSTDVDHVFVVVHDPAFPRHRHEFDSFNQCPILRNRFWNMLVANNDIVRAMFVGHTHHYYRMRVVDPTSLVANNPWGPCPDEAGGVYQVDAGASGNGERNVLVRVQIDGMNVHFQALDADNGSGMPWAVVDEWSIY